MKQRNSRTGLLLLTILISLSFIQTSAGQQQEPWQVEWQEFGAAIAPYASEGVLQQLNLDSNKVIEFNRTFGKEVEWTGIVKRVHTNTVATTLLLEMTPLRLTVQDGSEVATTVLQISCSLSEDGCIEWTPDLIDQKVQFRTRLVNRTRGIQPVVRIYEEGKQEYSIRIETQGAQYLALVP